MIKIVINVLDKTGYLGLVFLIFIENVFPPIPSEFIIPLAGFLVTQGKMSLVGVIAAGTIGSVLGALPLFYLGRRVGEESLKNLADRHGKWLAASREDIDRAGRWFDKHGGVAVLLCRLVPGIRSFISIPAGIGGMSLPAFLLYTTMGAGLWTTLLACAGLWLGQNFARIEEYLNPISYLVLAVIVVTYIARVLRYEEREA